MSATSTISASRVGRKPIAIPAGVEVKVHQRMVTIKGPKGQLTFPVHPYVDVVVEEGKVKIKPSDNLGYCRNGSGKKTLNAMPGTLRSEVNNAVLGVSKGFERRLKLEGVGYRVTVKGRTLYLTIGYSHPVEFVAPEGITIEAPSPTEILIKGSSKPLVGHVAAEIRDIRRQEPYKGKGIVDPRKPVIRKETKKK